MLGFRLVEKRVKGCPAVTAASKTRKSIREHQIRLLLLVAGGVLLFCLVLFTATETYLFTRHSHDTLRSEAGLLAENILPTLLFEDHKEAQRLIESLSTTSEIVSAKVFSAGGKVVAEYRRDKRAMGPQLEDRYLASEETRIVSDGTVVGVLRIDSDLSNLHSMYRYTAVVSCFALLVGLVLAYVLASWAAERISYPLMLLAGTAVRIAKSGDYSVRLQDAMSPTGITELKEIKTRFDSMLDYIQGRDKFLDREVDERTQELMEARKGLLDQAKLSALGEMAGGIAHEINNPLAIILGRAQRLTGLIKKSGIANPAPMTELVDRIAYNVERIEKIIRSLRSVSRDGTKDPFETVSVRLLIDDALELCRNRFKNHGVELRVQECPKDLFLRGRATQICQIS